MSDTVRGATLFLMLTRSRFDEDILRSGAFYASGPFRRIRREFAEKLLLGPLDNQLLPFLARNLDVVSPLAAELLLLYERRRATHESGVTLMLILNELVFDRMAWKVQELARTQRRVTEETAVLLSEYQKVIFDRPKLGGLPRTSRAIPSVPHHELRMRVSDHVGQPHRFAPKTVLRDLRRSLEPDECLVTFRLDRNGLWLGLIRAQHSALMLKVCDSSVANEVLAAHREDTRSGSILLWNETDYSLFGETVMAPLQSFLGPEVRRIIVLGSQVDLPIHAAYMSGGGYAIEHYCIMYEQSRRSLAANRARQTEPVTRLALVAYEGHGEQRLREIEPELDNIRSAMRGRLLHRTAAISCRSARTALKTEAINGVHLSGHMRTPADVGGWLLQLRDGELDCLGALRSLAPGCDS